MNWNLSIAVILGFILIIWYRAQTKFKNKMLCTFHRPNSTKIEKWVPMDARHVVFDQGKYGIGRYHVDSECIELQWYDRGINKLFPTLIPTLEFFWNMEEPLNPKTKQTSWRTPEVLNASWEEHQHIAYAKNSNMQVGLKQNKIFTVLIPIVILGAVIILGILWFSSNSALQQQVFQMQQQIKNIK